MSGRAKKVFAVNSYTLANTDSANDIPTRWNLISGERSKEGVVIAAGKYPIQRIFR